MINDTLAMIQDYRDFLYYWRGTDNEQNYLRFCEDWKKQNDCDNLEIPDYADLGMEEDV